MVVEVIKNKIAESSALHELVDKLQQGQSVNVKGLAGSLKAFVLAHLFENLNSPILYVSHQAEEAESVKEDLEILLGREKIAFLPSREHLPYRKRDSDVVTKTQQMEALEKLVEQNRLLIVTSARGLAHKVPAPSSLRQNKLSFQVGKQLDFEATISKLALMGFSREPQVEQVGEMSVRGGIVDIFPYSRDHPVRIEFFGDKVESIREFDVATQRSTGSIQTITIYPQVTDEFSEQKLISLPEYLDGQAVVFLDEPNLISDSIEELWEES
ncbi:MAG: hypothetical protein ONB05_04690, partial [candidate division KSB1 bacterium]|nr:hypothetical protein [candidate division KSB1 bacterium]